jgi:N-acetylmuramic acid 6-phosphate etherase
LVGITASGRTPYTIGAVEYARRTGALTIGVTCNAETELHRAVEIAIEPIVGPEVIAGSTRLKAGTAQKLVLNMLSTLTMVRLGYVSGNRMSNLQARNTKLRERALGIVAAECELNEAAARAVLETAGWDLRVALVMCQAQVSREQAEAALHQAHFSIARAVASFNS